MKFLIKIFSLLILLINFSNAKSIDLYFSSNLTKDNLPFYFTKIDENFIEVTKEFKHSFLNVNIKTRILNPPEDSSYKLKAYLEKPFFIIDGIHLSTTEKRTLNQLQAETEEFGILEILKNLGYTPILVQFTETVNTSLEKNAETLNKIFNFFSENEDIPFLNKKEEGFIVLGISQGGIIGRYGAYLYDINRSKNNAPIRLYASLDSPHQGAVMPRSLISTINYWATLGGSASAEAFNDLIKGPGARDLLIYQTDSIGNNSNTSDSRFLFSEYRKAAEYKEFPSILVSQGQLKGIDPKHEETYYNLNRKAELYGVVVGRATSKIGYSNDQNTEISHNSAYEFNGDDSKSIHRGFSDLDFVQGSTYPFPQTLYTSLREGMLEAMPNNMKKRIGKWIFNTKVTLNTSWERDGLYQEKSTFIPTVSAMDLKCDGDLAIRKKCAHNQTEETINFTNPGSISSGKSIYAVDKTHPRYNEPISGRHIESPIKEDKIDENVLTGMQTDMWRILCEVAKVDYDYTEKAFRNPKLNGLFSPTTNCMDQSKMPSIIREGGKVHTKRIAYARYTFNEKATEINQNVKFSLPAGWQKVAKFNIPDNIPDGASFEIDIQVNNPKSKWMKAELLLLRDKRGNGQIQLTEMNVSQDGKKHTLRWVMPNIDGSVIKYKWFELVLNSNGADITLSNPKIITSTADFMRIPTLIKSPKIYPNENYTIMPWSSDVKIEEKNSGTNKILYTNTKKRFDGLHIDLKGNYSFEDYSALVVEFEPGTCTRTEIYFDSKDTGNPNLGNYSLQNNNANKIFHLSKIINTQITPNQIFAASKLKIQATQDNEKCNIKSIYLQ